MRLPRHSFYALCLLATCWSTAIAQPGGGTTPLPSVGPDNGTVLNSSTENANTINAWVSRSKSSAIAIHIFEVTNPTTNEKVLKANLRQYADGLEVYPVTTTTITNNGVGLASNSIIPVKLVNAPSARTDEHYKLIYTAADNTEYEIGTLTFVRGSVNRPSSKVNIKLYNKTGGVKVTPGGINPCEEPPIEDIGEEMLVAPSPTNGNAPTGSIPRIPPRIIE